MNTSPLKRGGAPAQKVVGPKLGKKYKKIFRQPLTGLLDGSTFGGRGGIRTHTPRGPTIFEGGVSPVLVYEAVGGVAKTGVTS